MRITRASAAVVAFLVGSSLVVGCTISGDVPDASPAETSQAPAPSPAPTLGEGVGLEPYYSQELNWADCGDGFQCATLIVPMDYANPDGDTVSIQVNRHPASGSDRIGSLVINPGGPGGSGLDYARSPGVVSQEVLDAYDLVGFDPRGVGSSSPIDCVDDQELDAFLAIDASPDDPAEETALDESAASFAAGCEERSGAMLPFMGTVDVARDLDVLRAALGDDQLHYLGKSYGTLIGALYAEQFPDKVGRMVLDGVVDPTNGAVDSALGQAVGFEHALRDFLEDCQSHDDCPLIGPVDDGVARIGDLLAQIDAEPIVTSTGRELTESLAVLGLVVTLYDATNGWPLLRTALTETLENGTAENLLAFSDFYTERANDGTYPTNSNEVIYAVNCMDQGDQPDIDEAMALMPEFKAEAPVLGPYVATGSVPCSHWPVPPTNQPHEITAPGAAPILVIGTTGDPATPYESSVALAESLESGSLLTFEGDGHTAYEQGSSCVDDHVDTYLLTGETPSDGTTC